MDEQKSPSKNDLKHPVLTGEYAIYTPPMNDMINAIGDWIDQRLSGGYIYGPSRFGKSRSIKWFIRSVLEERFGQKLPMIIWIRPPTRISEGEFWNQMLEASKFKFFSPLKPKKKFQARFLFKQQLITVAKAARQNYVTLVIDEAHDVTLNEWKWLMGLQNDLDNEGYRLSVFSIGSHQINFQPDYLANTGNAHIVARFFCADSRFYGITSVKQMEYVLNGYDLDTDWPLGTNTSFLKYFAPDDFANNKRLVSISTDLFACFKELLPTDGKGKSKNLVEIPMLHVAQTIEQALHLLSKGNSWEEVIKHENLLKMIAKTGFTEHIRAIRAPC
jgi:hypothetical protein